MVDAKPGDSLDSMVWSSRTDLDVETSRVGSLSRMYLGDACGVEQGCERRGWSTGVPKEAITNGSRAWTAGLGYTEASKWVGDKRGDQLLNGAFYNKGTYTTVCIGCTCIHTYTYCVYNAGNLSCVSFSLMLLAAHWLSA